MKRSSRFALVGLILPVLAGPAFAQEAVIEGPGVALGEGAVFHPSISLEGGYVSNVFRESDDPVGSAIMRLIGAFSIASQTQKPAGEMEPAIETEGEPAEEPPPPAKIDFRFGGQAILDGYISDNEAVQEQTDVGVGLNGDVVFLPQGDVSFRLADEFLRDTRPTNFELTNNLNRDFNHFTAALTVQPQGRTISAGVRYENTIDRFESEESAFANRLQHIVGLRGEWRLFPYTKLFADASLGFFGPLNEDKDELNGEDFKASSNPLRVLTGIGTALTEVSTVRAYVGYANGFYDEGQNFSNVIGGAELGFRYTQYGRIRFLADYNFHDSLQANYFRDYSLLAAIDHQVGLFVLGADAGMRLRGYRGISAAIGDDARDDVIFTGTVRLAYLLRDWFAITARGEATVDSTEYTYMSGMMSNVSPEYERYEAYLGVSAAF